MGFFVLLAIGLAAAWFARISIAKVAANRWCATNNISCEFDIVALDTQRIELENLVITGPSVSNLITADTMSLDIDWQNLFSPVLSKLAAEKPTLIAAFDGQNITFDGLEKLISTSQDSAPSNAIPALDIRDGQLTIVTPAGDLSGTFEALGLWPQNGSVNVTIAPANLESGDNRLSVSQGELSLSRIGDTLSGKLNLAIATLRFEQSQADNVTLSADMFGDDQPRLSLQAEIQTLVSADGIELSALELAGEAVLAADALSNDLPLLQQLVSISATGQSGKSSWQAYEAGAITFDLNAAQTTLQRFELALDANVENANSPSLSSGGLELSLTGAVDPENQSFSGHGNVNLSGMQLARSARQALLKGLAGGAPFDHHVQALKNAAATGLSGFTTGGEFRVDAAGPEDWQIIFPQTLAAQSQSGAFVAITPSAAQSALTIEPGAITLAGVLSARGGGLPNLTADIQHLQLAADQLRLDTGGITLRNWSAGPLAIAATLNRFNLVRTPENLRIGGVGELRVDGRVLGAQTSNTRLFGGLNAARGAAGWRVQTIEQKCLGLSIGSISASDTLHLQDTALNICPQDGRFMQQVNGGSSGIIQLGDISLPFTGEDVSGTAAFENTQIDWRAKQRLTVEITADTLNLPMQIGSRDLSIQTQSPKVDIAFDDITRLTATMGETQLGGRLVPANVTIGKARFDGSLAPEGFQAVAQATDVGISDIHDDPYYNPLTARVDAVFTGPNVTLSGPIHLASSGLLVGNATLDMNLLGLNGTGQIVSEDLIFARRGLQPVALSDRVRGILTNGRGQLNGKADFSISGGKISGNGNVVAAEFGFDNLRIGAIDGINGEIEFDDIMTLTTPPGQNLTIAKVSPGIPLENGELDIQIVGGTRIEIERATWPLAGGWLTIKPAIWTIGAESDAFVLQAEKLELEQLVEVLSLPDIKATGTISGDFPIVMEGGNALIQDAKFFADNKGGTISYTGTAASQAGLSDERVDAAFTALRDFRFRVLEVGVDGNLVDEITLSARLLGSNPEVYGGADFDFKISIESKLAQLIKSSQRAVAAKWIAEAVAIDPE